MHVLLVSWDQGWSWVWAPVEIPEKKEETLNNAFQALGNYFHKRPKINYTKTSMNSRRDFSIFHIIFTFSFWLEQLRTFALTKIFTFFFDHVDQLKTFTLSTISIITPNLKQDSFIWILCFFSEAGFLCLRHNLPSSLILGFWIPTPC